MSAGNSGWTGLRHIGVVCWMYLRAKYRHAGLASLLNNVYEDVEQLEEEIDLVAKMLVDAAE